MINIRGIDKAQLLLELYNHSHQQGMGIMQPAKKLTIEDARELLKHTTSFDYIYGKVMKVDLSSDEQFEEWLYDRDNGTGMAQSIVNNIRMKMEEAKEDKPINNFIEDKPIKNMIETNPIKNTINEVDMVAVDNTITEPKTRIIDLDATYIGIYDTKEGYKIGLFEKSIRQKSSKSIYWNGSIEAQYYEDLLSSNGQLAFALDENGRDKKSYYTPFRGDPENMDKWNGICDAINFSDVEKYDLPPITGVADRHINLVQFTSVYPELQGNVSIDKIIGCLADFCEKFNLQSYVKKELAESIKASTNYLIECAQKGEFVPSFVNLPVNEFDVTSLPKDFNENKHTR